MHEVAPSAVSTAVITDAMICSVHFSVSLLLIKYLLSAFRFYIGVISSALLSSRAKSRDLSMRSA